MTDITIEEYETMVSFDVVSLFTAIPVDKACAYIRTKLEHDTSLAERTQLDIGDFIRLLSFALSNSFLVYNNTTYKQIHSCAMGSAISAVVANICMEVIEEQAIHSTVIPPKVWKRFVDDSLNIKRSAVLSFHDTPNSIDPHINFTIEYEEDVRIAFLDTLICRNNCSIFIDVYRKPTHTEH